MSLATDLASYLVAQGLGSATPGAATWLIRASQLVETNQPQVAVMDSGGLPEIVAHDDSGARRPSVHIHVRGGTYAESYAKVQAIYNLLKHGPHEMNGNVYHVLGRREPVWLGYTTDRSEPQWSLNFQLGISQTTL